MSFYEPCMPANGGQTNGPARYSHGATETETMTDEATIEVDPVPASEPRSSAGAPEPIARAKLGAWWREGARTAVFFKPDWTALDSTPNRLVALVLIPHLVSVLFERLTIVGPAYFYWPGILSGWLNPLILLFGCR